MAKVPGSRKLPHALLALAVLLGCAGAAYAQEDTEQLRRELAEEKARVETQMQQLEEQMSSYKAQLQRLDDLERRLEASMAHDGQHAATTSDAALGTVAPDTASAESGAATAVAPELVRTAKNETKDSHAVITGSQLVADNFLGSWPLFGTDYRLKIGGYFKLDALYDLDGAGDKTQFLISQIPVDGSPEAGRDGYFNMFVRETRWNFDVRNASAKGLPEQFFLEMDFFDERNFSPRLRHAYMVYGNLLVGQTWTTIAELASLTYTIDFAAGDALFGTRTPQVRWQQHAGQNWSWAVGLEQQQTAGIYNPLGLGGSPSSRLPVLGARLTHQHTDGLRTLALMVQELRWDGEGIGPDATAVGWALIFGGRQNFGRRNFFTWNLAYGDGTADTIMALTGSDANAVLTDTGRLITRRGYSAALGLGLKWTADLSSNLSYAWTDLEDLGIGQRAPDAIQSGAVGHVNLIWTPAERVSTGVEFMWGYREDADGSDGDAARIQTMVKYDF